MENIEYMQRLANENGIPNITFVIKAFAGNKGIIKVLEETNLHSIGDSRIHNLKQYESINRSKMLLRIPMISETKDVLQYSDISLQSELSVIKALNQEAKKQNKKHNILIMFDLGDLREGIYYKDDYIPIIQKIQAMKFIQIKGIGTNLTCYGGLVPDETILNRLIDIKHKIEANCHINLEMISGGNSSSVTLFGTNKIPQEINHLRLGESILFGKETSYSTDLPNMHHDVFELQAEIIECKQKPSIPDGTTSINSFGEVPEIEDLGIMTRIILAIGKQDLILSNITPKDKDLILLGGSSDHLILATKQNKYRVGDIISFEINYPALVHLMSSDYVQKVFQ